MKIVQWGSFRPAFTGGCERYHVNRCLKVTRTVPEEHLYKQTRRGRPGPNTAYHKVTKRRFDIEWTMDEEAIACDHKSEWNVPADDERSRPVTSPGS